MRAILAVGLMALVGVTAWAQGDWSATARKAAPSVVTVTARGKQGEVRGTGFYISADGKVATNHHVIEGASVIRIRHEDGKVFTVQRVIAREKRVDLAILQTNNRRARPLTLGDSDKVQRGQEICVIGSPLGALEGSVTTGVVSAVRTIGRFRMIQISAPISQGNSGSPVLNRRGEVIGVASGSIVEGQNLNLAVPINYLKRLRAGQAITPAPAAPPEQPEEIAPQELSRIVVGNTEELMEAIRRIKDGGEILLEPGEYRLPGFLLFTKSVTLQGSGADKTVIIGEASDVVVGYLGEGLFALRDLSLRYSGSHSGAVLSACSGEVRLTRCMISGATAFAGNPASSGIYIEGSCTAILDECLITSNDIGIQITGNAKVKLEKVECVENYKDALLVRGNAVVEVRLSKLQSNGRNGIVASDTSKVAVVRSIIENNKGVGILLTNNAVCEANRSEIRMNSMGITVANESKLSSLENTCEQNNLVGITVSEKATVQLRNTTCRGNGAQGLVALNTSYLTVEWSTFEKNVGDGISIFGNAKCVVRNSVCHANRTGISAYDYSSVTLEKNNCYGNSFIGIHFTGSSTGLLKGNTCRNNPLFGISADENAKIRLEQNVCQKNEGYGIYVRGSAICEADNNLCIENGLGGIGAEGDTKLIAIKNNCVNNEGYGIELSGKAFGDLRENKCQNNDTAGILAKDQSKLVAVMNICEYNKVGIIFMGSATGELRRNNCYSNEAGLYIESTANPIVHSDNRIENNQVTNILDLRNKK